MMKKKNLVIFTLLLFLIVCSFIQNAHSTTAKEILNEVSIKYASLTSYCDSGSVKRDSVIVNFETYFTSPETFLFKWEKTEKLYFSDFKTSSFVTTKSAIRSNREGTFIFFYYDGDLNSEVEKYERLKNAIFASTGVSWGSSLYIPTLLFQGINDSKLTNLRDTKIVGIQKIGEKECYIITGTWLHNDTEYKIWIEKDGYLIKKFIVDNLSVYSYDDIKINERIAASVFEFQPDK